MSTRSTHPVGVLPRISVQTRLSQLMYGNPDLFTDQLHEQCERIAALERGYQSLGTLMDADAARFTTEDRALIHALASEVSADHGMLSEALQALRPEVRRALAGVSSGRDGAITDPFALASAIRDVEVAECGQWNRVIHLAEASGLCALAQALLEAGLRSCRRRDRLAERIARWSLCRHHG